ncbi:hypothetical protein F0562_022721 [Nyssa sinensis]|uniref:Nuclease associated modular domain-containing protein n=1 Tax=Nyssa sinensis TaxID=561372 RepID=A0A5J5BFR2_9ASTE|nr:hypothetical protein F0562_022721 [Nyssa sinensis]
MPLLDIATSDVQHECHHNLELDIDSRIPVILPQSSSEDSEKVNEKEKLRRMRISIANKGNTPWNKGKKHSPEILQRIRERTRLAMQDPKVKMKLVNLGHAQSKETRIKIGVGVRMGWERRREKLMLQETCYFEWQKLITEASRRGFVGQKGTREHPSLLSKGGKFQRPFRPNGLILGTGIGCALPLLNIMEYLLELKESQGESQAVDGQSRKRSPVKKKVIDADTSAGNETKSQSQRPRLRRSNMTHYKDPLVSSKLEMIKNIKAQRTAAETKKTEAVEHARLLIAEAEKAAKALEVAAMRSPLAQASLIETRKLIAEAIQSIESIKTAQAGSPQNGKHPSFASNGLVHHVEKGKDAGIEDLNLTDQREINGIQPLESSDDIKDFNFGKFTFQNLLSGKDEQLQTSSSDYGSLNGKEETLSNRQQ